MSVTIDGELGAVAIDGESTTVVVTSETREIVVDSGSPRGPQGPPGPTGPEGPPGASGVLPVYYLHEQISASAEWAIVHNLGYRPNVRVKDSAGTDIENGDIIEETDTYLIMAWRLPFTGEAYCT